MTNEGRKESRRRSMAKNGCLIEVFTQKSFLKVYPCFGIDRVKFSFADIGTKGKGFDIYIELDDFDLLCDDILDRTLQRKLLSEKATPENKYPCSWQYVTGNNAEKNIRISKGMKSEVNIHGKVGKEMKNIPMSYDTLRTMAKYFRRVAAGHFEMLTKLTLEGIDSNAKMLSGLSDSDTTGQNPAEDPRLSVSDTAEQPYSENQVVKPAGAAQSSAKVSFKTKGNIKQVKEALFFVPVINRENKNETNLFFNKESIESLGAKWNELKKAIKKGPVLLNAIVHEKDGSYLFISM